MKSQLSFYQVNSDVPIKRVFSVSALRKHSQQLSINNNENDEETNAGGENTNIKSNNTDEDEIYAHVYDTNYNTTTTLSKKTRKLSLLPNKKINKYELNSGTATQSLKKQLSEPNKIQEIYKKVQSELDIDEKYLSEKKNPIYKSDSEVEEEEDCPIYIDPITCNPLEMDNNNISSNNSQKSITKNEFNNSLANTEATYITRTNIQESDYESVYDIDYLAPVIKKDSKSAGVEQQATNKKSIKQDSVLNEYLKEIKSDKLQTYVNVKVTSDVLRDNLAVVCVLERLWIIGCCNTNVSTDLFQHFHIGDILVAINEHNINNIYELDAIIKKMNKSTLVLKIQRLPFARIISITKELIASNNVKFDGRCLKYIQSLLGIKFDSKARIETIDPNGLVFKVGLKFNPNRVSYDLSVIDSKLSTISSKNRLTKWSFTEVNGKQINLMATSEEVCQFLSDFDETICFVVQPSDLIKLLVKELKKKYQNWKNYLPI